MRLKLAILLGLVLIVFCAHHSSQSLLRVEAATQVPTIQEAPPTPTPIPAEDTGRYVEWMNKRGTPVNDKPHEKTELRISDWGFFYHGDRPVGSWTPLADRTGLDRKGHAVTEKETSDWYAFLSTKGINAKSALKRVAWLFNGEGLDPAADPSITTTQKEITAPKLTNRGGVITFQGWVEAYSDPPYSARVTIVSMKNGTKVTIYYGKH